MTSIPSADLTKLVDDFARAERALRELAERAHSLSSAEDRLKEAEEASDRQVAEVRETAEAALAEARDLIQQSIRSHKQGNDEIREYAASRLDDAVIAMRAAQSAIRTAEKAVADSGSAVYRLAEDLAAGARELREATAVLRTIDPQRLEDSLVRLSGQLRILVLLSVSTALFVVAGVVLVALFRL